MFNSVTLSVYYNFNFYRVYQENSREVAQQLNGISFITTARLQHLTFHLWSTLLCEWLIKRTGDWSTAMKSLMQNKIDRRLPISFSAHWLICWETRWLTQQWSSNIDEFCLYSKRPYLHISKINPHLLALVDLSALFNTSKVETIRIGRSV